VLNMVVVRGSYGCAHANIEEWWENNVFTDSRPNRPTSPAHRVPYRRLAPSEHTSVISFVFTSCLGQKYTLKIRCSY